MATVDALGQYPFAYIYANTTGTPQTISDNTMTSILFNAEVEKIHIVHSIVSNTDQFILPQDGYYVIGAAVSIEGNLGGSVRTLQLTLNGSEYTIEDKPPLNPPFADNAQHLMLHGEGFFTAGQTIRLQIYQNSGGNLDLTVDQYKTNIKIQRIR